MLGSLHIQRPYGHPHVGDQVETWETETDKSLDLARELFNEAIGNGYFAYVKGDNGRGVQVYELDPFAETILAPQLEGG